MDTLRVYDFDDTLAVSQGVIRLVRGGKERVYKSHEFVSYEPLVGDELCFSDLNNLSRVRIIKSNWEKLLSESVCPLTNVAIVTSRPPGAASAIGKLLKSFGVGNVDIRAIGSGKPKDKVEAIRSMVIPGRYRFLHFVDDNPTMVKAVEDYFSEVKPIGWTTTIQPHLPEEGDHLSHIIGDFLSDDYQLCRHLVR